MTIPERIYCSFCGNSQEDAPVMLVVKGDDCAICDRCVDLAMTVCIESRGKVRALAEQRRIENDHDRQAWAGTGP